MIKRTMQTNIKALAKQFPVIAILGPRQSGKTTLAQSLFKTYKYISFEELDNRENAISDPRKFLEDIQDAKGVILDEIQHAPPLLSYIQTHVDKHKKPGFFILSGSQNFLLHESITQSLAGRVAIFTLLPLSIGELTSEKILPKKVETLIFKGSYPSIHSKKIHPQDWYPHYMRTYIERDVRQIKNITSLSTFQRFIKLCAGRIGQLLNITSLGNDCGISSNTVKEWLSILEASYILFLLQPHHKNFNKRLVKSPKLYFYDTGLACSLLNIESKEALSTSYMRGNLFESFVISEFMKQRYNIGRSPNTYFWRDKQGHEIDCIIEAESTIKRIEIKSGKTINSSFFGNLSYWNELANLDEKESYLVYAGEGNQSRSAAKVLDWQSISKIFKS